MSFAWLHERVILVWKFDRTLTFSPLLGHDIGEYTCSIMVIGFNRIGNSGSVMVMANGMNITSTTVQINPT